MQTSTVTFSLQVGSNGAVPTYCAKVMPHRISVARHIHLRPYTVESAIGTANEPYRTEASATTKQPTVHSTQRYRIVARSFHCASTFGESRSCHTTI